MLVGQGQPGSSIVSAPRGTHIKARQPRPGVFGPAQRAQSGHQTQRFAGVKCHTAALEREAVSTAAPGSQDCLPAPQPGRLQNNATNFVEEHRIRAYEVGADQKATLITLANLLQVLGNTQP